MEEVVYLNGELVPRSQARVSPFDHGFLYGYALFETMRAYSGRVFLLRRRIDRILRSARSLGMASKLARYDLEEAVNKTIRANGLSEAKVRLTVSPGPGEPLPDPSICLDPTVLVIAQKYEPPSEEVYERGFKAVVSPLERVRPLPQFKSTSYLGSVLARMGARELGADEALLVGEGGRLAEGSTTNLFLILKGEVVTPSEESGLLPGITREVVMGLARGLGLPLQERGVTLWELLRSEEAFLTNSMLEVMPLTEVEGKPLGSGRGGPVTRRIREAYREMVGRETGG